MLQLKTSRIAARRAQKRRGFTLVEIMVALGALSILSALILSVFGRTRVPVRRAQCDVHLKEIALAADTFRQERGRMPVSVGDLLREEYLTAETLRCPSDPDFDANKVKNAAYTSYGDGYVIREPRDNGELPILVCPHHEKDGAFGAQAFKGGYTKQFSAHPALLKGGDWGGVVTITRPGAGVLSKPAAGKTLLLRGGDHIDVRAGHALIRFEDGSTATIGNSSEMSVMQSFTEGQRSGKLYTLVRQFKGTISYYVNPGNRFDVTTPTATAGALGTRFSLEVVPATNGTTPGVTANGLSSASRTILSVQEHTVALSTAERTIEVVQGETVEANSADSQSRIRRPRTNASSITTPTTVPTTTPTTAPTTTPTTVPTTKPTTVPTTTPTSKPKNNKDKDKHGDDDDDDDDDDD